MDVKGDSRSDLDLVAAVNGGDWAAFDVLYHRHRDWVLRLAWRFTQDENDAHDVVQDVFIYLAGKFRSRGGLELRAGLTTLLYPAVKHTALALSKKRKRMGAGLSEDVDVPVPPTVDRTAGELAAVLARLSDAHREIVLMRFVDEMTLEEIAAALAIPVGTAKSRLHHALADLRGDAGVRRYFENG